MKDRGNSWYLPPGVQALEATLASIRFRPRPSLRAELLWRLRSGGERLPRRGRGSIDWIALALAGVLIIFLLYLFWIRLLTLAPVPVRRVVSP